MFKIIIFFLLFVSACSHFEKKPQEAHPEGAKKAEYEFQASVKDSTKGADYYATISMVVDGEERLRADITTTLGVSVATVVVTPRVVTYLIPQRKAFYKAKVSSNSLKPLFSAGIHPKWFFQIVQNDFPVSEWNCRRHEEKTKCTNKNVSMNLELYKEGEDNKYRISNDSFEIDMVLSHFLERKNINNNLFKLKPPKHFKRYTVH